MPGDIAGATEVFTATVWSGTGSVEALVAVMLMRRTWGIGRASLWAEQCARLAHGAEAGRGIVWCS